MADRSCVRADVSRRAAISPGRSRKGQKISHYGYLDFRMPLCLGIKSTLLKTSLYVVLNWSRFSWPVALATTNVESLVVSDLT